MSVQTISVKGPALRVALIGAYLAQRWLSPGRDLVLLPDEPDHLRSDRPALALRPDHLRFHSELGLPLEVIAKETQARLLFAPSYTGVSDSIKLPFLPIGGSYGGVDFQHYWLRAHRIQPQPDLMAFSQAMALEEAGQSHAWDRLQKGAAGFGLTLDRESYTQLLLRLAAQSGANVAGSNGAESGADLVFDCSGCENPAWSGSVISVYQALAMPGIEWQVSVNAARRFIGLSASTPHNESEQREYTRLAAAEAERIADMEELLAADNPEGCTSPTLRRKTDLFTACGRIPTEDFEVFTPTEWLAALWQAGLRPRRYDRMANLLPQDQLMAMLAEQIRQIKALMSLREPA